MATTLTSVDQAAADSEIHWLDLQAWCVGQDPLSEPFGIVDWSGARTWV